MANPIDLIVTQEAIKGVDALIAKVTIAREGLLLLGQQALNSSKSVSKISTPSGLNNNTTANAQINADIKKQNTEIEKLHATIAKGAEQSRLAEIRLQQAREKSFDSYSKALAKKEADEIKASNKIIAQKEREFAIFEKQFNKYESDLAKKAIAEEKASQKAIIAVNKQQLAEEKQALARRQAFDKNDAKLSQQTAKELSAYNRIQASVNLLTKTYQDLAIRKQLGNTLSASEEKQLVSITSRLNTYQTALKSVDANMQKHTRNVGNYASGYNGLGNSINQITRELPAFTFSAQTGFLALSNNIPILTDEIGRLIKKNKELKASGQETTSVLKQILGGVFGLQTLMGIAILAFTVYGKEIANFFKGTTEAKEAQKALNEEVEKSKFAVDKETVQLKVLTGIVNDHTKSSKNRKLAYDEIKEVLPGLTSQTYENAIATGELSRVTDLYTASLIAKNIVEIKSKGIAERQSELDFKMSKTTKERLTFWENIRLNYTAQGLKVSDYRRQLEAQDKAEQDLINTDIKSLSLDLLKSNALENQVEKYKVNTKGVKESITAKKEEAEALRGTENWYNSQINKLKEVQSTTADTTDEYKAFTTQIELLEKALKALKDGGAFEKPAILDTSNEIIPTTLIEEKDNTDPNAWMKQYAEDVKKAEEETIRLKEATDNWIGSFSSDLLQNSGLGSLETFFDGTFDKLLEGAETTEEKFAVTFNAIAESAQEAFNFIANASQANFDNERKRIEDQQNIAISYAGGSAVAIAKINEDAEKRKKEVTNRENKAKQKQAIFNIAIDTAQAIIASVAKSPETFGLPFSAFAATIGAVQIGLVASQKIPQYFDGTDNHTGGLMLVNDGKGANYQEKVILPNGKEITPQGRNVLMDAPKGTKVLTHEQQLFEMMQSNGINMTANINKSNGMTANQMDVVLGKHFSNIKTHNTTFDKNGFKSYLQNGNSRTIMNQNRVSGSGISV